MGKVYEKVGLLTKIDRISPDKTRKTGQIYRGNPKKSSQTIRKNTKTKESMDTSPLSKIYNDPSHLAGFSTARKLWESSGKRVSLKKIKEWLNLQDAHTLHHPIRKKFKRNVYMVDYIDETWQCDLNDMRSLKKYYGGYMYVWAIPLKNKSADEIIKAFRSIFKQCKPLKIQSDKGTEFNNKKFKAFLSSKGIKYYVTNNLDVKAAVVERSNRTLKTKMYKYFTRYSTFNYVAVLPKLIQAYNNLIHSSIVVSPASVNNRNAFKIILRQVVIRPRSPRFSVGDHVRILKERMPFKKSYKPNFTTEIFRIESILRGNRVLTYKLADLNGEPIVGSFYELELSTTVVSEETEFKIEKIIKRRRKGRGWEYFVKWMWYPESSNSWVKAKNKCCNTWLFKLPSTHATKDVTWLKENYHGLDKHSGDIEYSELGEIIRLYTNHFKNLFTKGAQKSSFLRSLLPRGVNVINLELYGCPSLKKLETREGC
ncbi:hypothetical protein J437_LFUL016704 [Ladona fulva]|uniref:Integrase catalytic domain-containing protein n=1 Tax=Ladona fulva TaxID=123851 RepID=A0A8K0KKX4_LADFU|nr:hypothetical protein J437_LFUL016704 [Ladona fulva]